MARINRGWLLKQAYLIVAALLLAGVTFALHTIPFRWLHQASKLFNSASASRYDPQRSARIAWSVRNAARFVPRATCLPQAIVTQFLLLCAGQPGELRIGVVKDDAGRMLAHAWVEENGRVVIGGSESPMRYAVFNWPRQQP